jgi:hypothetical protein
VCSGLLVWGWGGVADGEMFGEETPEVSLSSDLARPPVVV